MPHQLGMADWPRSPSAGEAKRVAKDPGPEAGRNAANSEVKESREEGQVGKDRGTGNVDELGGRTQRRLACMKHASDIRSWTLCAGSGSGMVGRHGFKSTSSTSRVAAVTSETLRASSAVTAQLKECSPTRFSTFLKYLGSTNYCMYTAQNILF